MALNAKVAATFIRREISDIRFQMPGGAGGGGRGGGFQISDFRCQGGQVRRGGGGGGYLARDGTSCDLIWIRSRCASCEKQNPDSQSAHHPGPTTHIPRIRLRRGALSTTYGNQDSRFSDSRFQIPDSRVPNIRNHVPEFRWGTAETYSNSRNQTPEPAWRPLKDHMRRKHKPDSQGRPESPEEQGAKSHSRVRTPELHCRRPRARIR